MGLLEGIWDTNTFKNHPDTQVPKVLTQTKYISLGDMKHTGRDTDEDPSGAGLGLNERKSYVWQ